MSVSEQNKATVRRFNKEFIEEGDMDSFKEIIDTSFVNHTAPPGVPKGPDGVVYFFNHLLKPAFPDLVVSINDQVAENDKVTTYKTFIATHKGEFFGIPASGKKVLMEVIDIIRLKDGRFTDHWSVVDWQAVMQQITN
jgi:predicted ester cyclase